MNLHMSAISIYLARPDLLLKDESDYTSVMLGLTSKDRHSSVKSVPSMGDGVTRRVIEFFHGLKWTDPLKRKDSLGHTVNTCLVIMRTLENVGYPFG